MGCSSSSLEQHEWEPQGEIADTMITLAKTSR